MTPEPACVRSTDPLRTAIETMRTRNCRRLPVVDDGELVGIISDRDVRLALNSPFVLRERHADDDLLDRVLVAECMTPDPVVLPPGALVIEAARLMHDRKFGGIPIVDGGRLVGIVTITDILSWLIKMLEN
jgi:acetoin utilization protein AcuB